MKKTHRIKKKKGKTIALLYHYVPKENSQNYYSQAYALVDNQTEEIVIFFKKFLRRRGYRVQIVKVEPDDLSSLKQIKADYVFNLVDSKKMELRIAKILDRLRIPHSGSSFKAIQTGNNKVKTKHIFRKFHIPTPVFQAVHPSRRLSKKLLPDKFPLIVKPAFEHCSIGITNRSIAFNYRQFKNIVREMRRKYQQTLLVEKFIPGQEFQVTILETKGQTVALPIAEIAFKKNMPYNKWNIYGFDEKWSKNLPIYKSCYFVAPPPKLKESISEQIKRDAIKAFYALEFRDYGRFDLRYNPEIQQWYFLEGNANAGFDPDPRDAMTTSILANRMSLEDFVLQIIKNSLK